MRRIAVTIACSMTFLSSPAALAQDGVAPAHAQADKAPPPKFETAERLLDALETADAKIDRLSAGVRYTKVFAIAGDAQQRQGVLRFQLLPRKMFEIEFRTLQVGGDVHDVPQTFVFDGQWFTEVYAAEKLMIHRRVVPPGEALDPFDLEQGPFPLPIGQRKDVILERFDTRLADASEGLEDDEFFTPLREHAVAGRWVQLVLTPRDDAGLVADDGKRFETLRMWYDPETLLPRLGMSVEPIEEGLDDVKLIEFFAVRTNEDADEGQFIVDKPPEGDGWDVIYRDDTAQQP